MILSCFDYFYYRSCQFYSRFKSEKEIAHITSGLLLSLFQTLNVVLLFLLGCAILKVKFSTEKTTILGLCAFVMIYNYFRYKRITFGELEKRWKDEPFQQRKRRGWLIILYILISFPITMFLFAELGKMNNG